MFCFLACRTNSIQASYSARFAVSRATGLKSSIALKMPISFRPGIWTRSRAFWRGPSAGSGSRSSFGSGSATFVLFLSLSLSAGGCCAQMGPSATANAPSTSASSAARPDVRVVGTDRGDMKSSSTPHSTAGCVGSSGFRTGFSARPILGRAGRGVNGPNRAAGSVAFFVVQASRLLLGVLLWCRRPARSSLGSRRDACTTTGESPPTGRRAGRGVNGSACRWARARCR